MSQHQDPDAAQLLQRGFIECAKVEFLNMDQVVLKPDEDTDNIFVAGKLFIVGILRGRIAMAIQSLDGSPDIETTAAMLQATTLLPDVKCVLDETDLLALIAEKVNTITVLAVGLDGNHNEKVILFHHPLINAGRASAFLRAARAAMQAKCGGKA